MFFLFPVLTVSGVILHLLISKIPKTRSRVLEIFVLYILVVMVGFGSIWSFMGHAFMPDTIAEYIGWSTGSPFQFEVASANLAFGLLGILSFRFRDNFWTATVAAVSVFYWGAAYGHIMEILNHGNYAPGNAGAPLYFDIVMPLVLIIMLSAYRMSIKKI